MFKGVAYQYTVLPFELSLAPHTITKCIDAALSQLKQMGIRILKYLDDWLILARSERESQLLTVFLALKTFLPAIHGHHVLVRSDNMTVVAYINRQGGLRSHSLYRLARRLLFWAQNKLLSQKTFHVLGSLNYGTDMLSRGNVALVELTIHPHMVQALTAKLISQYSEMLWPAIGAVLVCMPSPDSPASSGHQTVQREEMLSSLGGPTLEETGLVPRVSAALSSSPVTDSTETRSSLAGENE